MAVARTRESGAAATRRGRHHLYDEPQATIGRVTRETVAGGMSVNETLMHLACESLPFGGVGASGMGAYHGYEGFVTFSKMKPVLTQRASTRAD